MTDEHAAIVYAASMIEGIAGYHFDIQFGPMVFSVAPIVAERARAVGIAASGRDTFDRRATMIRVAGTHWAGLRTGEIHGQILEQRNPLDGYLVQEPCLTSKQVMSCFGLS